MEETSSNDLKLLSTEERNPRTRGIDTVSTLELVRLINAEDKRVASAVEQEAPRIADAIDRIAERMKEGGRLIYIGAGTSGRLGVLDASECSPTFGVAPDRVVGIIAGGYDALYKAVESCEDIPERGAADLRELGVDRLDSVVGIAASGRTPYTIGAGTYAREEGAGTIALTCNPGSSITEAAEMTIAPATGPEAISGSTRMKAGTAQKMALNLLSTGVMIRLGLVYDNLMSNLQLKNAKLRRRAALILAAEGEMSLVDAEQLLEAAQSDLRTAMVMRKAGVSFEQAIKALQASHYAVRAAIQSLQG